MERRRTSLAKKTSSREESDSRTVPASPAGEAENPYLIEEQEETACLAYSFWEARGCQGGLPEEDWLRAEEELQAGRTSGM
jgi:hypothetical protein